MYFINTFPNRHMNENITIEITFHEITEKSYLFYIYIILVMKYLIIEWSWVTGKRAPLPTEGAQKLVKILRCTQDQFVRSI